MNIKVMSFNIRIDVAVDGKHAWPYRKHHVLSFINNQKPDILGIQEAGPHMVAFLHEDLKKDYHMFTQPRDAHGESTPLFIRKHLFKVIKADTIWLTDTPHVLSVVDGSNHPRIATYAILKTQQHDVLAIFNTHLDYTGDQTTLKQVKYLQTYIKHLEEEYCFKTIILGDFNSYPESQTVSFLSERYQSCFNAQQSPSLTFHGFSHHKDGKPIDYIFFDSSLKYQQTTIHHHTEDDMFLSDHYPISTIIHL